MKITRLCSGVLLCFAFQALHCFASESADAIKAAELDYDQGRYDEGIQLLSKAAEREPRNYKVLEEIAVGYHWKKDCDHALSYYMQAEKLRGNLSPSKIMLLYEIGRLDDVISACAEPTREGKVKDVAVIGALVSSYMAKNQPTEAQEFTGLLRQQKYQTQYDQDYQTYILSYYSLWRGDVDSSLALLRLVSSQSLKNYAKTDPRFKVLFQDARFLAVVDGKK